MASLARRNLFHDKVRLGVTLTGIVFALVLIAVQGGLFLGFTTTTSNIIDHSNADLWISSRGLQNFDSGAPFSERKLYQVLATPGISFAEKYIVGYGNWKKPDGGEEGVEIVGFNPDNPTGGPWNITAGGLEEMLHALARKQGRAVVVVTHDTRTLSYADRIVSIEDGRLATPHIEKLANRLAPELENVWRTGVLG